MHIRQVSKLAAALLLTLMAGCAGHVEGTNDEQVGSTEQAALFANWTSSGVITSSTASRGSYYGRSVAVYGDRVALTQQLQITGTNVGSAQVFKRNNGWVKEITIDPLEGYSARSIAMSDAWLAVGEICVLNCSYSIVRLFQLHTTGWFEIARLGSATPSWDFGRSLALSGNRLLVNGRENNVGKVYEYIFSAPWFWTWVDTISEPRTAYAGGGFGYDIALDGNIAAISNPTGTRVVGGSTQQSPGFVYTYSLTGAPTLEAKLQGVGIDLSPTAPLTFGSDISLSGSRLAVAAPFESGRARTAYLFSVARPARGRCRRRCPSRLRTATAPRSQSAAGACWSRPRRPEAASPDSLGSTATPVRRLRPGAPIQHRRRVGSGRGAGRSRDRGSAELNANTGLAYTFYDEPLVLQQAESEQSDLQQAESQQ